jgi:gamma-glutamyl:cysteine ligase YbdK (ATP-grasp superfamily)
MGQEIQTTEFSEEDERRFEKSLRNETKILKKMFDENKFENPTTPMCGLELEAWITDENFYPAPECESFLEKLNDELIVPEISKFNFELNCPPERIESNLFTRLDTGLRALWDKSVNQAEAMGLRALSIGSLPTIRQHMLSLEQMYPNKRYFALNDRILKLRQNLPVILDIKGKEQLTVMHHDVMLEAAATSLQIHLQTNIKEGPRFFNASTIMSPLMVAVGANSPYLYGKCLWSETRVPIFEQAINLGSAHNIDGTVASRVSLGNRYVDESLMELFIENLDGFPAILPDNFEHIDENLLPHLKLHNGTIWRWNRPLIGFDENNVPHVRIEHRVPSSGPSIPDVVANVAFYLGVTYYLAKLEEAPETKIYFHQCRSNFYEACKLGLNAEILWIDGKRWNPTKISFRRNC